tara:strand:+ start:3275 stop:3985 length:711 start_codon:yes stop_codon:yes gene_type:complete
MKRLNGRRFDELRSFKVTSGLMDFPLSSVIVQTGRTSVLCSVCLQKGVPKWLEGQGKGWLSAEYRLLPGSTPQRKERELAKLSGRTQEIQRFIGRNLRNVIDLDLLAENTLIIDCDVIQADAGTRTASVTGSWIALHRACDKLLKEGLVSSSPLINQIAAVSVGIVKGRALLDIDFDEDSQADVDLSISMNSKGEFVEIQGASEKSPFSRNQLHQCLDLAEEGIKKLQIAQLSALE